MPIVQVGCPVPDFTLPASDGSDVSLGDFRGKKLVLFFYPRDLTPTCTAEACDFRDNYAKFQQAGAEVAGISPDSVTSHRKFVEKHRLPFLLLADEERKVCEMFGVWQPKKMYGRTFTGVVRSTFLIDENGVLQREWRNVRLKDHIRQVWEAATL